MPPQLVFFFIVIFPLGKGSCRGLSLSTSVILFTP